MEKPGATLSAAVREHLRRLCLREFPCGTGSWVRAAAGGGRGAARRGTRGSGGRTGLTRGGWGGAGPRGRQPQGVADLEKPGDGGLDLGI